MANDPDDIDIDALLADAGRDGPTADLTARVLADAARVQADRGRPVPRPRRSRWRVRLDAIGGWPVLSGVAAAGIAGVALGFFGAEALDAWAGGGLFGVGAGYGVTPDLSAFVWGDGNV